MTAVWAALLVVAAIALWPAAVQLQDAKVCTISGFEERGDLIGQTSGGVYLAEHPFAGEPRRVATFTAGQTEEVFIGDQAADALCDPSGLRGAALASLGAAEARIALRDATASRDSANRTTDARERASEVQHVAEASLRVADQARKVALAADRTTPGVARPIWDAQWRARDTAAKVRLDSAPDQIDAALANIPLNRLLADANRALDAAREASAAADRGEKAIVAYVQASKP
jgi:hypothetical protein